MGLALRQWIPEFLTEMQKSSSAEHNNKQTYTNKNNID